jgi:hypothetical protein
MLIKNEDEALLTPKHFLKALALNFINRGLSFNE